MIKSSVKKNTMVFIDAENVSSAYAESINDEIWDIGEVSEVRYYAMQKDPATECWKDTIKDYDDKPILMSGDREKNKIDNKIIRLHPVSRHSMMIWKVEMFTAG